MSICLSVTLESHAALYLKIQLEVLVQATLNRASQSSQDSSAYVVNSALLLSLLGYPVSSAQAKAVPWRLCPSEPACSGFLHLVSSKGQNSLHTRGKRCVCWWGEVGVHMPLHLAHSLVTDPLSGMLWQGIQQPMVRCKDSAPKAERAS